MTEKLKPCPFCGSETAHALFACNMSNRVSCSQPLGGCGASGPYKSFPIDDTNWDAETMIDGDSNKFQAAFVIGLSHVALAVRQTAPGYVPMVQIMCTGSAGISVCGIEAITALRKAIDYALDGGE